MKIIQEDTRDTAMMQRLLEIWESAVRATHHFLSADEIIRIRQFVPQALRAVPSLLVACDEKGDPAGFMGIDGHRLEMLFISEEYRGKGIGRQLLCYGIDRHAVDALAVNEQNPQARAFYEAMGFTVCGRSETDEQGGPYPLLYMRRQVR